MIHPAYLAGMIDGEGSIMLPHTGTFKRQGVWASFTPKVAISNTCAEVLERLKESYGGKIEMTTLGGPKHKQGYRLRWFGAEAVAIVGKAYPYLIIKTRQADALIKFDFLRSQYGRIKSDDQVYTLAAIAAEIQAMNKRGI